MIFLEFWHFTVHWYIFCQLLVPVALFLAILLLRIVLRVSALMFSSLIISALFIVSKNDSTVNL